MADYPTDERSPYGWLWVLLIAAAIVLLILFVLGIFSDDTTPATTQNEEAGDVFSDPEFEIEPDEGEVTEDDVIEDDTIIEVEGSGTVQTR